MKRAGAAAGAVIAPLLLLAAAPPKTQAERGAAAYQKCYACHALEPGKHDLSGPSLHRILGRRIAAAPGFDYSPALRALAERERRWNAALLARFIADPEAVAPHNEMGFVGMTDAGERAALILFLRRAGR